MSARSPALRLHHARRRAASAGRLPREYLLTEFWATWCGPCLAEVPHLKAARDAFAKDDLFVMLSLSLDDSPDRPRDFIKGKDRPWDQGYLGPWSKTPIPEQYEIGGIP